MVVSPLGLVRVQDPAVPTVTVAPPFSVFFQAGLLAEVAGFCPLPVVWVPPSALVSAALGLVLVLGFSWGFAWVEDPAVPGFVSAPALPVVLPAAAPLLPLAVGFGVVLALLVSLGVADALSSEMVLVVPQALRVSSPAMLRAVSTDIFEFLKTVFILSFSCNGAHISVWCY